MLEYLMLIGRVLDEGEVRQDRTGVGTKAVFSGEMRFNLRRRFPLVTVKETRWKTAFIEMLWFLRGEQDLTYLHKHGVHIWDAWASAGRVGPIYGYQWRNWQYHNRGSAGSIDQIKVLIDKLKTKPTDRRLIVTAWNPGDIPLMGLPPCHYSFQCYVSNDQRLSLKVHIRSWDVGLGAPFNIAQYALLTHLLAQCAGLKVGELIISYGDAHIYLNHLDAMREVHNRKPFDNGSTQLIIKNATQDIDGFSPEDFTILDYQHHPHVPLPIAV